MQQRPIKKYGRALPLTCIQIGGRANFCVTGPLHERHEQSGMVYIGSVPAARDRQLTTQGCHSQKLEDKKALSALHSSQVRVGWMATP